MANRNSLLRHNRRVRAENIGPVHLTQRIIPDSLHLGKSTHDRGMRQITKGGDACMHSGIAGMVLAIGLVEQRLLILEDRTTESN